MRYEVEMKFRVADHDQVEARLREARAVAAPACAQTDVYFQHPARDFALTREALRLRLADGLTRITYKGPKLAGPTKTREEIELDLDSKAENTLESATTMLVRLGFQPIATLRKTRRAFTLSLQGQTLEVALDDASDLGRFVEVETIADSAENLPAARQKVLDVADRLGLEGSMLEPRSYLSMRLEQSGR